jgi:hypothetical protein
MNFTSPGIAAPGSFLCGESRITTGAVPGHPCSRGSALTGLPPRNHTPAARHDFINSGCGSTTSGYRANRMTDGPYGEHISNRVNQATGIISVQAGCDLVAALALLIARAAELDQSLEHTALDVLDHLVRFDL